MENNSIFVAFDGDSIGSRVGKAVLADDIPGIKDISGRIQAGQDAIAAWAISYGAEPISFGGDEASYQVPAEAMETLEQVRKDYEYATDGMSCTVGVGSKLSEAGKALMVGKLRGKNQICQYDQSVEQEYVQAEQAANDGTATGEAAKIGHAYMEKDKSMKNDQQPTPEDSHDDCPYCKELEASGDSDPEHCDSCHDEGDDCPYCNEMEGHDPESDDHDENCPYCQEMDAAGHDPMSPDHEDDCEYCKQMDAPGSDPADPNAALDPSATPPNPDAMDQDQPPQSAPITDDPSEHSSKGMEQVLAEIVNQDGEGNSIQGNDPQDIDDAAQPIVTDMEGNVSRPAGYSESTPGDMGIEDDEILDSHPPQAGDQATPDFGAVLKDSLESHANAIQKERVMSMVTQALQGFKANKSALETAKAQVPGLYQSNVAMIKAMIEMAKLLGLEASPSVPADQGTPSASSTPAPGGEPVSPKPLGQ